MSARLTAEDGAALIALARAAIEERLFADGAMRRVRDAITVTPALAEPRACFVTLKTPGPTGNLELRGCIGSTEPRLPAHEAAVASAVDAAFFDPRFKPLTRDEHPGLVVSVSVLTPIEPVPDALAIVVGRDGVALESGDRRALFLPDVASEQGWTRTELLEQLALKAGLPRNSWKTARLATFQSESFGETPRRG